jgi:hypothetical protein
VQHVRVFCEAGPGPVYPLNASLQRGIQCAITPVRCWQFIGFGKIAPHDQQKLFNQLIFMGNFVLLGLSAD